MNDSVLAFNGERADPLNKSYSLGNGYRAYKPDLMCFESPDSFSPFGTGGINPYAYCAGDPVNQHDPSGHHSPGSWLGIGVGLVLGLLMTPLSAGTSLAAALSVVSVATAVTSAGLVVAQQFIEVSDPAMASALGWAALGAGIVSGLSSAALSRIVPGAKSLVSLLKGSSNRPFGGLMISRNEINNIIAASGGQFRHARFIGVYSDPAVAPGHFLTFSFQDNIQESIRLNIVGQPAMTSSQRYALGSGNWLAEYYAQDLIGFSRLARIINNEMVEYPDIRSVRLLMPCAGATFGRRIATYTAQLQRMLQINHQRLVPVTGPVESFRLSGGAVSELGPLQNSLRTNANHELIFGAGRRFTPDEAQDILTQMSARYGNVQGAFSVAGGVWW